jgi:hypothetical protein
MGPALCALLVCVRTLLVPSFAASGSRCTEASAGRLSANHQAATHSFSRPNPLVLAVAPLGHLAGGSGLRSARDRDRLEAQTLS